MSTIRAISTELLKHRIGSVKFLLNDSAIAFFPAAQQHRDIKLEGLSYEDDYRGKALAGLATADHVEIRFHSAFSDERVRKSLDSSQGNPRDSERQTRKASLSRSTARMNRGPSKPFSRLLTALLV